MVMMLLRIFPLIDLSSVKSLRIRCDEYPVPAGIQCEKELVSKGQGVVQAGFRHDQIDEQPFCGFQVPGGIGQPACLEEWFRVGGQRMSIRERLTMFACSAASLVRRFG